MGVNDVYIGTVRDMLKLVYPAASDGVLLELHTRAMEFVSRKSLGYEDVHHSHWSIAATMIWLSSVAYSRRYPEYRKTQAQISEAVGSVTSMTMRNCRKTMGYDKLVIYS